jgi:hypothetical protein
MDTIKTNSKINFLVSVKIIFLNLIHFRGIKKVFTLKFNTLRSFVRSSVRSKFSYILENIKIALKLNVFVSLIGESYFNNVFLFNPLNKMT